MSNQAPTSPTPAPIRMAVGGFGVLFVVLGVLGSVPGVTSDYHRLRVAGPDSGRAAFRAASDFRAAQRAPSRRSADRPAPRAHGVVCSRVPVGRWRVNALLWVYGVAVERGSFADVVPLDDVANRVHLGLALTMTALGVTLGRSRHARSDDPG